ncbi:MAG: VTT domain-containing protein [Elusimicrobiota bacterium]
MTGLSAARPRRADAAPSREGDAAPGARAGRRFWLFAALFAAIIAALAWALEGEVSSVEGLRAAVSRAGGWAPLVYIGLLIVRPFSLFSAYVLFAAGGLVFGAAAATLYSSFGYTLGALLGFCLARYMGRDFVESWIERRPGGSSLGPMTPKKVFLLNVAPIIPNAPVNLAAGFSRISPASFTLATALGITPCAFCYSYLGHALDAPTPGRLLAVAALATALTLVPLVWVYSGAGKKWPRDTAAEGGAR